MNIIPYRTLLPAFLVFILCSAYQPGKKAVTLPKPVSAKSIDSLVKAMTLEEKIALLHGSGMFFSGGVSRLGIPELTYADGPLGIREEGERATWNSAKWTTDSATFFPNGSALAATWNPELAYRYGAAMGEEARARKKDILLAPAINITRTPLNGRTFEYLSEDPFLNTLLAVPSVKGIQSQDVAACVKHFAVNNQETNRGTVNVEVSERALREIYFPAFKASVQDGNAYTLMAAYNKFRGEYCAESDYLLNKVLRKEWGFKGLVMSDWSGTHSTVNSAKYGLDIEMGSDGPFESWFFAKPLLDSVKTGKVDVKLIDEKVRNILGVMLQTSMKRNRPAGSLNTPAHVKTAYDIAAESIVLLKNETKLLPLKAGTFKSIAVIGDNATKTFARGGFGAGVKARYEVTILEGIKSKFGKNTAINYARGYAPARIVRGQTPAAPKLDSTLLREALAAVKSSDITILCIGSNREYETEATDRTNLTLPYAQQALVDAVTAINPNVIVLVVAAAPYDLNQIKQVNRTVLWSWFNGSENGNAVADVLSGKINPSGKMPFTFPKKLEDSPAHALNTFPGDANADYKEGILVGYRWFDTKKIDPLYCFGYGLSYTNFSYAPISTNKKVYHKGEKITATIKIKNTGRYAGKETVQFYVSDLNSKVFKAEKQLKAFNKISISPGKEATVSVNIKVDDLAYFDEKTNTWIVEPGNYKLIAASSSKDLRQSAVISVK
ncbi:MAG: glycoside hydrolase family 3 C-terminal domain-containing protein [Sphingobacteriaceae bacterium]|nr:glycoside hydrolase family 3 C-terminal domain-containing protein [Sphingobacteriaceae bacterium]